MENDIEAKQLALDFITRCRGEGRTIETIANAAGWILQIIAQLMLNEEVAMQGGLTCVTRASRFAQQACLARQPDATT